MSAIEQGLKLLVLTLLVGFIMYVPPESHTDVLRGQQPQSPAQGHNCAVQSWIAPNPCPIYVAININMRQRQGQ